MPQNEPAEILRLERARALETLGRVMPQALENALESARHWLTFADLARIMTEREERAAKRAAFEVEERLKGRRS